MTMNNPHFRNGNAAAREIGMLLQSLPEGFSGHFKQTDDSYLKAEALAVHIGNATESILFGIGAIGRILASAAVNEDQGVELGDVADVGYLLGHLSSELQLYREIESECKFALQNRRFLEGAGL